MAQIKIIGVDGAITVSTERALKIAEDKKNIPNEKQKEMWITIGAWQGYFSKVQSVLIEKERTYKEDYERPLTEEEEIARDKMLKKARANLEAKGLIKPKKPENLI